MADTPENTAASVNTRPATPRTRSLWRRVRRAARVVVAVVLGVVCVVALVAWPMTHSWQFGVNVRRGFRGDGPGMVLPDTRLRFYGSGAALQLDASCGSMAITYIEGDPVPGDPPPSTPIKRKWRTGAYLNAEMELAPYLQMEAEMRDWDIVHIDDFMVAVHTGTGDGKTYIQVAVPFWLIALMSLIFMYILLNGGIYRRLKSNQCENCGYSRVGLPIGAACPECGSASGEKVKANAEDAEGSTEVAEGKE
ncbi:MAG: hypothetical protein AB7J76_07580 [Phycisphaerales bacterium]